MKKALQLASVASMIDQFTMPNIELLQSLDYHVDVVADFTNPGNISPERSTELIKQLESMNVRVIDIAVPRRLNPKPVISAYLKVKDLIAQEHYDLVHCHSPIGGAITRLAAKNERKNGTKVIYTAHGFHFYKGAPLKNWIAFYTIEKWLSRYTDVLITINTEDYERAKRKFKACKTVLIPGIGIDVQKFRDVEVDRAAKRAELGISNTNDVMLLSVGELNKNKNHRVAVEAIGMMDKDARSRLYYVVAGKDAGQYKALVRQAEELDVNLCLLGFRMDISELLKAADLFLLPSIREGLNVGLMEAMASGVPCLASDIRGNRDLIAQKEYLFNPAKIDELRKKIEAIYYRKAEDNNSVNAEIINKFDRLTVEKELKSVYQFTHKV